MKAHFSQLRTPGLTQLQLRLVHNTWKGLTKKAAPFELSWTCAIGPDMCARVIWCLRKKKIHLNKIFLFYSTVGQVGQQQPSWSVTPKTSGTASWLQPPLSLWGRWTSPSCWVVGTPQQWRCLQQRRLCRKTIDTSGGCVYSSESNKSSAVLCCKPKPHQYLPKALSSELKLGRPSWEKHHLQQVIKPHFLRAWDIWKTKLPLNRSMGL